MRKIDWLTSLTEIGIGTAHISARVARIGLESRPLRQTAVPSNPGSSDSDSSCHAAGFPLPRPLPNNAHLHWPSWCQHRHRHASTGTNAAPPPLPSPHRAVGTQLLPAFSKTTTGTTPLSAAEASRHGPPVPVSRITCRYTGILSDSYAGARHYTSQNPGTHFNQYVSAGLPVASPELWITHPRARHCTGTPINQYAGTGLPMAYRALRITCPRVPHQ